jgi:hypothetical protein
MLKRIIFSLFFVFAATAFADEAENLGNAPQTVEQSSSSEVAMSSSSVQSSSSAGLTGREVPVRYWVKGDSVELEAIFVKIENDTVYLKSLPMRNSSALNTWRTSRLLRSRKVMDRMWRMSKKTKKPISSRSLQKSS